MQHYFVNRFLVPLSLVLLFSQCKKANPTTESQNVFVETQNLSGLNANILKANTQFEASTLGFIQLMEQNPSTETLQQKFDSLRKHYKKVEWAVAYFMPETTRFLNGPNLGEIELEEHTVLEPEGLQVLEEFFYPQYNAENKKEVIRLLKKVLNKTNTIRVYFQANTINSAQVFDAFRNEVFRITTLGLPGFDTPVSGKNLQDARFSLEGFYEAFSVFSEEINQERSAKNILEIVEKGIPILKNKNRNTFDYAHFIKTVLNPLSQACLDFKVKSEIYNVGIASVIAGNAPDLFAKKAFNPNAFVPSRDFEMSEEKIELGKQLFYDTQLSANNLRACSSCHLPEKGFTDGLAAPMSLSGKMLKRNVPSLNYSNYQHGQFWDMRQEDLEKQSVDVITNEDEMHGDMKTIIAKLNKNQDYIKRFGKAFANLDSIKAWQLQNALASYIRSLSVFSSKFDQYMRNETELTETEKQGFNLFVGKAKCATCHFIPLFNGTVPPEYRKTESEVLGVAKNFGNQALDDDRGRGAFYETIAELQYAFKTPTLRNIEKTAPYMHNGQYPDLKSVMDFYNEGGGMGFGFTDIEQTLPSDKLDLNAREINSIIDFMKTLNDE
ncbi:MAG: cytochrome-c peroxidase [Flavobacteriaceae bacterium]